MKVGTYTSLNMGNSMVMFIRLVLDQKYPFWLNVVQKGLELSD